MHVCFSALREPPARCFHDELEAIALCRISRTSRPYSSSHHEKIPERQIQKAEGLHLLVELLDRQRAQLLALHSVLTPLHCPANHKAKVTRLLLLRNRPLAYETLL